MTDDVFNATLIERQDLTEELAIVRIRPDSGQLPEFEPGQFCTLGLPADPPHPVAVEKSRTVTVEPLTPPPPTEPPRPGRVRMVRRAYSIASPSTVRDYFELFVVLVRQGRFTPRLWTVEKGGRLYLDPKISGHFTLEGIPPDKDLIMVSTGTGLAPFVSMVRTYRGAWRWRRCVIIHGVRNADDLAYREELEQISREDPSVIYLPTTSREPENSSWKGLRGRVQTILDTDRYQDQVGTPLEPLHCHVFLCGNPAMIGDVEKMLEQRGFVTAGRDKPGNIHFERYW